tara:strand:- start:589 stop:2817 length:2229 start_codon:yes stop_codon:yes gene_type:complete
MTRLNIDIGIEGNPATGDTLRTAMSKINSNFTELYLSNAADGNLTTSVTNGNVSIQPNGTGNVEIDALSVNSDNITSLTTNSSVTITGNGTAGVDIEALSITGTSISSSDSSTININDNLVVDGTGTFQSGATIDGVSITDNTISTGSSNANLELTASGTGAVKVDAILSLPDGSASDNYIGVGDADDLKIFHNGSHSIIRETGTGSLYLQSDNNVIIGKDSGSETMIKGVADGAVELYHDNVKKLNTSSSGVTVVDELHTEGATPHLTLKRTDNANIPTLRFKGSGGTVGASIDFQGTGGTSNELAFQVFDGASLAERFRVTYTGAKVSGTLEMTDGLTIDGSIITSPSNADIVLTAGGTGSVDIEGIQIKGTEISSSDSTQVTIKENLHVTGNISGTITGTVTGTIDADNSTVSNLEVDNFKASAIVIESEGIGSNDNDTTIPTSAAVKDYVDNNAGGSTGDLAITGSSITAPSNADLTLSAGGTGSVDIEGIQIKGTEISSSDSTQVTIKENLHVTGTISGTISASGLSGTLPAISGANLTGVAKHAFKTVQIGGGNSLVADDPVDTLTIHPGNNVTITDDDSLDSFTINVNGMGDLTFNGSTIISPSNADITLDPAGTGQVVANAAFKFNAGYIENINTLTSSSTITVDCSAASIHTVTLATNTEFNISNLPTGGTVTLIITQDGSGSRTATFGTDGSTAVKFPGGAPTLSTGANDIDVVTIVNDGTNFLGNCAKNYS